ncbi:SEUSS-like 1 [Artemisia annua]|uniref:SEUSS-like 1 n=1 Tax=Artemisia annua TaxID=35608 RepID=A0A2U1LBD5_ARTAN|nr:SEUSS-like 1 [Artemisia annua]
MCGTKYDDPCYLLKPKSSNNSIKLKGWEDSRVKIVPVSSQLGSESGYVKAKYATHDKPANRIYALQQSISSYSSGCITFYRLLMMVIDAWQCDICGSKSGRGFEATFEVLPRLNEINFGSGVIDELLFLELPREYIFSSGIIVLE